MDAWTLVALLVGLLLGVVAGALVAWSLLGRETTALRSDNATLRAQRQQDASMESLLAPVRESLESLRRSAERASLDRAAAEATLTTQMAAVQERYASLESATAQIASALARGQTRGQWGEMQLETLLEHAGLLEGTHFSRQESRQDGSIRPDVVVHLAGGGEIMVDAKFPFDAYWQAVGTQDPGEREQWLRKHAADVLQRARELSGRRYSESPSSPDFVVMFLPLESLLSASLEADGLLLEKAFERRVVLATPTTMLALLRTVVFGYQRALMAQNAEEIRQAGAEMLTRLSTLTEHVESMRRGLDQAVRGYNSFVGSFDRQAMSQARRMADLGVATSRSLDAPVIIETGLRESRQ